MQMRSPRVVVFCAQQECLQQYAIMLNHLEVFQLTLCADLREVNAVAQSGQRHNLFIFDGFDPSGEDLLTLRHLGQMDAFEQFLLVGRFGEALALEMLRWGWSRRVPLLPVIEPPVEPAQLRAALMSLVDYQALELNAHSRQGVASGASERVPLAGVAGRLSGAVSRTG